MRQQDVHAQEQRTWTRGAEETELCSVWGTLFLNGGLRRQKPDYYYLGSKRQLCLWDNVRTGDNLCLWSEVCGLVCIQTHCGCQVAGVEIKLKIRLSGSPANHQHHIFLVMSLQMWARSLGVSLWLSPTATYGTVYTPVEDGIHLCTKARQNLLGQLQ